jgi:hypothetical protein
MANDSSTEETWSDWDGGGNRNLAIGTVVASALAAGAIAYVVRRRRHTEQSSLAGLSSRATDTALMALGDDRLALGREFLADKVIPEFKPALLQLLQELEAVIDRATRQAFDRAERAIKDL